MKRTNLEYIAEAVKGKIYARAEGNRHDSVTAVSIDSRDIPVECLFFAIIGERADAHRFLPDVYEKDAGMWWCPIRNGRKDGCEERCECHSGTGYPFGADGPGRKIFG